MRRTSKANTYGIVGHRDEGSDAVSPPEDQGGAAFHTRRGRGLARRCPEDQGDRTAPEGAGQRGGRRPDRRQGCAHTCMREGVRGQFRQTQDGRLERVGG